MIGRFILLMTGTVACSTAAIIIKASDTDPILLAGFRCLIAALILSPLYFRDCRIHRGTYNQKHLRAAVLPGIFLGLHFITWIVGVRWTKPENATLLVMMVPITMPFFVLILFQQKLNQTEWLATFFSIVGVVILTAGDMQLSAKNFQGDVLSLLSLLLLTYYMILARVNRKIPSIWLYVVPLYFIAGTFCLLCSVFFTHPIQTYSQRELILFVALALIPTVIGHSIFNYSMQYLPSQLVAIVGSSQFIFTGIMAYYILHSDPPKLSFYIAGVLVLGGVAAAVRARSELIGDREQKVKPPAK